MYRRDRNHRQVIKHAVDEFQLKFFVALLVVMIVSLISLGWRVGIVVAAAVPLTLSITLVVMFLAGINLDRISLGALILALGLLVDDAIIAIETMVVKMEEGWDRIKAAGYAWSHTASPMLAGTLVTIIGLMPIGRQINPGRICQKSLLGCLHRAVDLVDRDRCVYPLFGSEDAPEHSPHGRRICCDIRNAELPEIPPAHCLGGHA